MKALFLHTKDVMHTHNVSEKTARKIIKDVNTHYDLPKQSYVSIKAYCDYFRLDKDDVVHCLEAIYQRAS